MADVPYCVRGCGRRAINEGRLMGFAGDGTPISEMVCFMHTPWARVAHNRAIVVRRHVRRLRRLWRK